MSTEHHTHGDQRLEANQTGRQVEDPGIQVGSADEMGAASVIAEIPGDDAAADASAENEERWHDVLASFIDDPRGSVLAATELVVNNVSTFVAVLDQRRKSMLSAAPEGQAASTEDLRQLAATCREISKQLISSTQALTVSQRGKRAEPEPQPARREVIDGRFETARGRHVVNPHRDAPPAQRQPGEPTSQDQRR